MIRDGKASTNGKIMGRGQYFGHEMLLENFRRWHSVTSLTFLDAFRIEKADLVDMMASGAFPRMEVSDSRGNVVMCLAMLNARLPASG